MSFSSSLKVRLIGLFMALSLAVTYYYLVRPWALGVPGNSTNLWVFSAMSKTNYHAPTLGVWRPRIAGLWLAGRMFDRIVQDGQINLEDYRTQKILPLQVRSQDPTGGAVGSYFAVSDYQNIFGIYHAFWLFVFFLSILFLVEKPIFILLGCFGGIFYMYSPLATNYFYPWDFPSMTAFTVAILLWQQKRYNWMLGVILLGFGFKETVAVTAVLYFFTDLPMRKRFIYFAAAAVLTSVVKLAIMKILYDTFTFVTQDIIVSTGRRLLFLNIETFFRVQWNHVIFVNAGTYLIALLLPARNRTEWGIKAVLLVFLVGQMNSGAITEFRVWLEALPISLLCLRGYLDRIETPLAAAPERSKGKRKLAPA